MPSSLVTRMRNRIPLKQRTASSEQDLSIFAIRHPLFALCNLFHSTHIGLQDIRYRDGAVGVLIGFHHRNQSAAHRDTRAIERMDMTHIAVLAAIAGIHAPGLEVAAERAR